MDEQHLAIKKANEIITPTLMLISEDDSFADINVSTKVFEELGTSDKKLITYAGTDHYMVWLDGQYQKVENDAYNWIRDRFK